MMRSKLFKCQYNEKSDILRVLKIGEKIKGSAEIGDFIIDFNKKDQIVGVEILNISELLKQINIEPSNLTEIKSAEIRAIQKPHKIAVFVMLSFPKLEQEVPLMASATLAKPIRLMMATA